MTECVSVYLMCVCLGVTGYVYCVCVTGSGWVCHGIYNVSLGMYNMCMTGCD